MYMYLYVPFKCHYVTRKTSLLAVVEAAKRRTWHKSHCVVVGRLSPCHKHESQSSQHP